MNSPNLNNTYEKSDVTQIARIELKRKKNSKLQNLLSTFHIHIVFLFFSFVHTNHLTSLSNHYRSVFSCDLSRHLINVLQKTINKFSTIKKKY